MGGLRKFNCDIIKLLPPLPLPCIMTGPIERSNSEDILNHKAAWGGGGGWDVTLHLIILNNCKYMKIPYVNCG